jgi:ATP-dependent Clp protease ATP-binding subunit ClpC
VQDQLLSQGIGLELSAESKLWLAERGYDPTLGARPLRRAIQRQIEDPMSERILFKQFHAGETVLVDVENDELTFKAIEGFEPPPVEELAEAGPAE